MSVLDPKRPLDHKFWLPRGHFNLYHGSPEGHFSKIWLPRGHFGAHFDPYEGTLAQKFGSQEGILAHVMGPQ